jgi:uncharacterized 2Fe-2S/4Fe-4S cluster protein (DUF4445 family)
MVLKRKRSKFSVEVQKGGGNFSLSVFAGSSILQILRSNNLGFNAPCGGLGRCGRCLVQATGKLSPASRKEIQKLGEEHFRSGWRLACRCRIFGPAKVIIPEDAEGNKGKADSCYSIFSENASGYMKKTIELRWKEMKGHTDVFSYLSSKFSETVTISSSSFLKAMQTFSNNWEEGADTIATLVLREGKCIGIEEGETNGKGYLAACDIGTTTIMALIRDAFTGKIVGSASIPNPQATWGSDVVTRISHALLTVSTFKKLRDSLHKGVAEALKKAAKSGGVNFSYCYELNLVGNSVLQHLFFGLKPTVLSRFPFIPFIRSSLEVPAAFLSLSFPYFAKLRFLPLAGGFVGADLVGAILFILREKNEKKPFIVLDLGTNGEIALIHGAEIYACSTAAGPAFEGGNISCGMLAVPGAIDRVDFKENSLVSHVIGERAAIGICGSGLIDTVAALLNADIMDFSGRIKKPEEIASQPLSKYVFLQSGGRAFRLQAEGDVEITISQKDIRELQLAKGAIRLGMEILMEACGVRWDEIGAIFLAGAFGNSISPTSLSRIRLFPEEVVTKIHFVGNAALNGALLLAGHEEGWVKAEQLADSIKCINLESWLGFEERFASTLSFF